MPATCKAVVAPCASPYVPAFRHLPAPQLLGSSLSCSAVAMAEERAACCLRLIPSSSRASSSTSVTACMESEKGGGNGEEQNSMPRAPS